MADSLVGYRVWNDDTQGAIKDKLKAVAEGLGVGSVLTEAG